MRTELGIVGVSVLLILAGYGVLLGIGLVPMRVRALLAASGLAYLVGTASTLLLGIALLALGGELSLPLFILMALAIGVAGGVLAWRRRGAAATGGPAPDPAAAASATPGPGPSRSHRIVIGIAFALLAVILVSGLLDAGIRPLSDWDSWSIWTRKAAALTNGGLDSNVFSGAAYAFAHRDYPILLPLFESVYFRGMGGVDGQAVHAVVWLMYVAGLGSIAYLGSRFTRVWVWFPVVLALAFGSQFYSQLLTAYADVPMGLLAAPGVLCLGIWLRDLDWRYLAIGGLLLAAAASVKNEGLLLMVASFAAAAIVLAVGREWRPLRRLGLALAGAVIALVPWHVWVAAHDIKSNLPIAKGLDPGYLSDRSDRIGPTLKALLPMLEGGGLSYAVPLALTLALLALLTTGLRRVAAFYLLAGLGTFASVVWAFVIAPDALDWQIGTSGNRVIMGVTFVCLAALVHIGGLLDGDRGNASEKAPEEPGGALRSEPATSVREPTPA